MTDSDILLIVLKNYPLKLFTVQKESSNLNTEVYVSTGHRILLKKNNKILRIRNYGLNIYLNILKIRS